MRVTQKYLLQWLRDEFKRIGLNLEVKGLYKTHCRRDEYEAGAAHWIFKYGDKDCIIDKDIYIMYSLPYLQKELNNGYELYLRTRSFSDVTELDLRKK